MKIDDSLTLDEIKARVREQRSAIPELEDVRLSANKDELIEQVNAALKAHASTQTAIENMTFTDEEETSETEQPNQSSEAAGDAQLPVPGAEGEGVNKKEESGQESEAPKEAATPEDGASASKKKTPVRRRGGRPRSRRRF